MKTTDQYPSDKDIKDLAKQQYEANRTAGTAKQKFLIPPEQIDLPSKGLLYPKSSPLSKGYVEMKHMTAREEDILTTPTYVSKGIVIDKLIQALVVTNIPYESLILGDIDRLMISARVLGFGKEYSFKARTPSGEVHEFTVDLTALDDKPINEELFANGNKFDLELPLTKAKVTVKFLTQHDQNVIDSIIKNSAEENGPDRQLSLRLERTIVAVEGDTNPQTISEFVDMVPRQDAKFIRDFIQENEPGPSTEVELIDPKTKQPFKHDVVFQANFFYPSL